MGEQFPHTHHDACKGRVAPNVHGIIVSDIPGIGACVKLQSASCEELSLPHHRRTVFFFFFTINNVIQIMRWNVNG